MSGSKIAALENLPKKPQSPDDLQVGDTVSGGRFTIEARLGKGGVATVYKVKDATRGCTVALKLLRQARSQDPRELQRFRNEIHINEHIPPHPNLLQPFETGTLLEDGRPFLLSELGKGPTLGNLIILAPLDERWALVIFEAIARGLCHMHDAGVLHRDIKPSNIIVEKDGEDGTARLFDFGYAIAERDIRDLPPQARLTQAGELPGTKHYMAPEQVLGFPASRTTDVYALGISLYEALTGAPPFADLDPADAAIKKATEGTEIPDISTKCDVSPEVRALVMEAIAANPDERIRDARAFLTRVREIRAEAETTSAVLPHLEDETDDAALVAAAVIPRDRLPWVVLGVAVVALLSVLGTWLVMSRPHRVDAVGLVDPEALRVEEAVVEPRPLVQVEPEPTPEPEPLQPEPEVAPPEPSPPQPSTEPKPKTNPRVKPATAPRPEVDCAAERSAARQAADWENWKLVAKHTKHANCWPSRKQWERTRVKALHKSGALAACRRLAERSSDPEVQRYEALCASQTTKAP